MLALAVVLTLVSDRHGFHRDELYFRILEPAWGYADQPPLTPLLARLAVAVSPDPWAQRVPATVFAVLSVLVIALITRELGGGRAAQALAAWSYAFAATTLIMGHVLLTVALDLLVWPLVCLFAIRAVLRPEPRWWLAAGVVAGLSTYNKWLLILLVLALLAGVLVAGPRRILLDRWLLAGAALALVLALPGLVWQAAHGWPQLAMSRALSDPAARVTVWPFLLLLLGPPLVPIWVTGLVALLRRPDWRPVRFLAVAFAVLVAGTAFGGGQPYYAYGLLAVVHAAGCVPVAGFAARSAARRRVVRVAVAVNVVVSAGIALPLFPPGSAGTRVAASVNQVLRDQIGWPQYVAQVAAAYRAVPAAELPATVISTSNYGEAGAIVRYGGPYRLPRPYSGHNALWFERRPPDATTTVLVVGGQLDSVAGHFASCTVVARLRDPYDLGSEEDGEPLAVCRGPDLPWAALWPRFQHYD